MAVSQFPTLFFYSFICFSYCFDSEIGFDCIDNILDVLNYLTHSFTQIILFLNPEMSESRIAETCGEKKKLDYAWRVVSNIVNNPLVHNYMIPLDCTLIETIPWSLLDRKGTTGRNHHLSMVVKNIYRPNYLLGEQMLVTTTNNVFHPHI